MREQTYQELARAELEEHREELLYADLQRLKRGEHQAVAAEKLARLERRARLQRSVLPLVFVALLVMYAVRPEEAFLVYLVPVGLGLLFTGWDTRRWKRTSTRLRRLEDAQRADAAAIDA